MSEFKKNNSKTVPLFRSNKWRLDEAYKKQNYSLYIELFEDINLFPKHMRGEIFEKLVLSYSNLGINDNAINLISKSMIDMNLTLSKNVLSIVNSKIKKDYDVTNINTLI
ncbi:hypothetical protein AB4356_25810, partial [Vibrio lentus]